MTVAYAHQRTPKDQLLGTWKVVMLKATSEPNEMPPGGAREHQHVSIDKQTLLKMLTERLDRLRTVQIDVQPEAAD